MSRRLVDLSDTLSNRTRERGIPLQVLEDDRDDLVLVRPDRVVCWRGAPGSEPPHDVLETVTGAAAHDPSRETRHAVAA